MREFIGHAINRTGLIRFIIWLTEKFHIQGKGGWGFPSLRTKKNRVFQILMYHRVNDNPDGFLPSTPIPIFSMQMEYLAENYYVFSLEDMIARVKKSDIPERAVVVTFDDGYRDNFLHAFPILQKYRIPATIFLATGAIGTGQILWHDQVCRAISQTSKTVLKGFGNSSRHSLNSKLDKSIAMENILWYLRSLSGSKRVTQTNQLIQELEVSTNEEMNPLMLNWKDIRTMRTGGIRFGAHSVSHPILSGLSRREVRNEVQESKMVIEEALQEPVTSFAYPSGRLIDFTEDVKTILQDEGYECAVTTLMGMNGTNDNLFSLKRNGYWDHNAGIFGLRMGLNKFCY